MVMVISSIRRIIVVAVSLILVLGPTMAHGDIVIPDDTTVYLTTLETVIGKKSQTSVGQIVRARVWRDVIVDGQIAIKGGTPATAKVSHIKNRGIFGVKGKMSLAAIETTAVDGQKVFLTGGYHKEGGGRMLVSLGIGIILFFPALFVLGKAAELPTGTVMDSFTIGSVAVVTGKTTKPMQTIYLGSFLSGFDVEVLYKELAKEKKPKYFDFLITAPIDAPDQFVIDIINGENTEPIDLNVLSVDVNDEDEEKLIRVNVKIKLLVKRFKKGINTFEISYIDNGERVSEEVILQIEI